MDSGIAAPYFQVKDIYDISWSLSFQVYIVTGSRVYFTSGRQQSVFISRAGASLMQH